MRLYVQVSRGEGNPDERQSEINPKNVPKKLKTLVFRESQKREGEIGKGSLARQRYMWENFIYFQIAAEKGAQPNEPEGLIENPGSYPSI